MLCTTASAARLPGLAPRALLLAALLALPLAAACTPEEAAEDVQTDDLGTDAYAERMASEHAGDSPVPGAAGEAEDGVEVTTERVTYARVGGEELTGYLARPAGGAPAPGLIVIHEWWGLNENIEAMARMLAQQGYTALAVDLYGETAQTPERARELTQSVDEAAARDNLRQAYRYLDQEAGAPRVGVIGWCFGGGWSLKTALMLPGELDAAVVYYGQLITDRAELAKLETPLLGIFGAEDQGIPVTGVRELERVLADLGKDAEIHVYEGAGHAFANPSGERYEPEAARDAWQRTLAFLAEHLEP
ncbi:MAG TPA: dienelactone hydrolase family protein [Thermoanaerobaculia bacterium]|nr:dienelactone hydrolase family protein [Thermoanaerobaculia bacterium]